MTSFRKAFSRLTMTVRFNMIRVVPCDSRTDVEGDRSRRNSDHVFVPCR